MADEIPQEETPDETAPSSGASIDFSLLIGLVVAFGGIIGGLLMEGSSPSKYIGPSAAIIVFGGTFGVTIISVGMPRFLDLPTAFMRALKYQALDRRSSIRTLVGFAEKARREGLLVLEDDLRATEDEFLRRGVQLVV
ncbi:MAG: motA, partial [Thermoleophilia bacterium]|nr:motA [Thermoleophilia bacterium]